MTLQAVGILLSVVLGFAATITSSLVLFTLNGMKQRIEKLESGYDKLIERKNTCNQDYVGQVAYIRAINAIELGQKELIQGVANLSGSMKVLEQMPAICGGIAKAIVQEMKNNG